MFREGATAYEVLGVSKRSSQQDIKRVFRRLAVRLHPDKLGPFESDEAAVKANDLFVKVRVICLSCTWCARVRVSDAIGGETLS